MNQNQMVSGDGGGGIKLWDMNTQDGYPIAMWKEHTTEVSSVDWNLQTKDCFLSASWDNTIKLWTPMSQRSIRTFSAHTYCVYQALWSPRKANVFISASGDHSVRIWDTNAPNPALVLAPAHDGEVLSVDWNKYNENVIATAGVDRTIRLWDLRNQRAPYLTLHGKKDEKSALQTNVLPSALLTNRLCCCCWYVMFVLVRCMCCCVLFLGHTFAVRRIKWSPHRSDTLGKWWSGGVVEWLRVQVVVVSWQCRGSVVAVSWYVVVVVPIVSERVFFSIFFYSFSVL